jgi:peptidyl-prolyl cis-trans isomerase A (cyclophilin A)
MKNSGLIISLVFFGFSSAIGQAGKDPKILIRTIVGDIQVEIYAKQAPATAANFLRYVDAGLFKGASFYRVVRHDNQPNNAVKIEVIQGGLEYLAGKKTFSPVEHETTDKTGIHHLDGTISMARDAPGSADAEFFICIGDQPELDFGGRRNPDGQGFAAFGRVVEGMDVVRLIQQQPDDAQMLKKRIMILAVERVHQSLF